MATSKRRRTKQTMNLETNAVEIQSSNNNASAPDCDIRSYFTKKTDADRQIVQICQIKIIDNETLCNHLIKGNHLNNLRKHLIAKHYALYQAIVAETEKRKEKEEKALMDTYVHKIPNPRSKLVNVTIDLSFETIAISLLKEVVVHGRPIAVYEDQGILDIVKPILQVMKYVPWTINKKNMETFLKRKSEQMKIFIKEEVAKKMICVKVDGATYQQRYFVGINIQFRSNDEFHMITLGCVEMKDAPSSQNLASLILDRLRIFNIHPSQIYSITTDNGANYVKAVDDINDVIKDHLSIGEAEQESNETVETEKQENGENYDDDYDWDNCEIEEHIIEEDSSHDELVNQTLCFEDDDLDIIVEQIIENSNLEEHVMTGFRCTSHTFQLAVKDWMKDKIFETNDEGSASASNEKLDLESDSSIINQTEPISKLLTKVRTNVKKMRTHSFKRELQRVRVKHRIPLDNNTRWSSLYEMISVIIKYEKEIKKIQHLLPHRLSNAEWTLLQSFLKTLKPCQDLTIKLQKEDITISDVYLFWRECVLELQNIDSDLANKMIEKMDYRKTTLFSHPAFINCLYLDPRTKGVLNDEERSVALTHLYMLHRRILLLKSQSNGSFSLEQNTTNNNNDINENTAKFLDPLNEELHAVVKRLKDIPIYDIKSGMARVVKTTQSWKFSISQMKRIYVEKTSKSVMIRGESFYIFNQGVQFSIWSKGQTVHDFTWAFLEYGKNIDHKKVKDLKQLLVKHFGDQWMSVPFLQYFVGILCVDIEEAEDDNSENVDDPEANFPVCCQIEECPEFII